MGDGWCVKNDVGGMGWVVFGWFYGVYGLDRSVLWRKHAEDRFIQLRGNIYEYI